MPASFQLREIIADRYQLLNRLGRGGSGFTYQAKDLENNTLVALKILSLGQLEDWKKIELFDREAKTLQQLDHPNIPQYLDHFQLNNDRDRLFCIVQQLAPGKSLATLVEDGWQPEEEQVKWIADRVLAILVYLQDLIPPVIHRDIKPQNLIYRFGEGGNYNNSELFLVDFGAVQDVYHQTAFGSTVVGTYGYIAPEQFRGEATLATDLYGLATTLLFLCTGKPPSTLPERNLKLDFRPQVSLSPQFARWIEKCIEPSADNRFPSAEAALEVLNGNQAIESYTNRGQLRQPSYSSIDLEKTEETLTISIPPAIFRQRRDRRLVVSAIAWHLVVLFLVMGVTLSTHSIWGLLYAIAFFGSCSGFPGLEKGSKWMRGLLLIYALFTFTISFSPFSINFVGMVSLIAIALDIKYGDNLRRAWLGDLLTAAELQFNCQSSTRCLAKVRYSHLTPKKPEKVLEVKQAFQATRWIPLRLAVGHNQSSEVWYVGGLLTPAEKAWLWQNINEFVNQRL
jgi:serine/threonine protein kinase